ncbi:VWA domain-containing protein [Robertkochia aurantiaca]|uniref:VWA domain-containing protein n=1 Tax=Robertkochia aurantiaca TaxID=2873700 RepID=UPI001CCAED37|nr:VWA domain-containing protein [Robertkochia sp. 3YJGBD-33]
MRTIKICLGLIGILLAFAACGNADDDFNNPGGVDGCLDLGAAQLRLSIQDQFTTLPGKVSVFFKVNDLQGKPVSGLTASDFTIYESGRNDNCFNTISASESAARISPKAQVFNSNTILLLDLSNSVLSNSLQELKDASVSFINNVMPAVPSDSYNMAIYWFDGEDELHLLQELTSDAAALVNAVQGIDENISNDPSTDLYGAVIKAGEVAQQIVAAGAGEDIISAASVVVFTDGTDQASRYSQNQALEVVRNSDDNVSWFTIGLGAEIDQAVLNNIGTTNSAFASNKEELEDIFVEISEEVKGQANSFYLFEYCSPKRDGSGINQLVIQAIDGDRQGAVQTQFDATGFTAGCQ